MTDYIVKAPVKGFNGEIGSVGFHKGAATVTSEQKAELAYFRRKGFLVEEVKPSVEASPAPVATNPEGSGEETDEEVNNPPAEPAKETTEPTAKGGKKK